MYIFSTLDISGPFTKSVASVKYFAGGGGQLPGTPTYFGQLTMVIHDADNCGYHLTLLKILGGDMHLIDLLDKLQE